MKELDELVELAKEFDASNTVEAAMAVNSQFKAAATRETILAIAEAFRALEQRAEAAEAKLAELEKQEPYAFGSKWTDMNTEGRHFSGSIFNNAWGDYTKPLFNRPAPAINLAELVPSIEALRAEFEEVERKSDDGFNLHRYDTVYADDETQERWDLWLSCRATILRNIEEAK